MKDDEVRHATRRGTVERAAVPHRMAMRLAARVMTRTPTTSSSADPPLLDDLTPVRDLAVFASMAVAELVLLV